MSVNIKDVLREAKNPPQKTVWYIMGKKGYQKLYNLLVEETLTAGVETPDKVSYNLYLTDFCTFIIVPNVNIIVDKDILNDKLYLTKIPDNCEFRFRLDPVLAEEIRNCDWSEQ
jgi:hypothetical protein